MFEPGEGPRVFGMPPGADFPRALAEGLAARAAGHPPEAFARAEIIVNTRRMQRRIREIFDAGPPALLPRIRVLAEIGRDTAVAGLPPAVPPLRRRLELSRLVAGLLDRAPELAPRAALFDLTDSLAALMDEMQGEGVPAEALHALDVGQHSEHWQRSLRFLTIVQDYLAASGPGAPDPEARQRLVIETLAERWAAAPPAHPVIVAGSTGSRGATALLMQAVARLPQGAVVLPGFDFDLPEAVWSTLGDGLTGEDHPQFRFASLLAALGLPPGAVQRWPGAEPPSPARNRLCSLALRPAPVTDQWMREGRDLRDIADATAGLTLFEAPSPRIEAAGIALMLRGAAERGTPAALISPDRMLTRRVTAMLARWGIEPDDSAGRPLSLSAPGRFLRHVSALFEAPPTAEDLLVLLKHPLTATGADRGPHLRLTRELELWLRKEGPAFPDPAAIAGWAKGQGEAATGWAAWLAETLLAPRETGAARPLPAFVEEHIALAEALAAGPGGTAPGALWKEPAGQKAAEAVATLRREAGAGGTLPASDYVALFRSVLAAEEVRDPVTPHPGVMIWGTLEARVQGAELVILGGLNEGTWPELPDPDPWMSRQMRAAAGLLLPERRIGLAAHDFQQAIAAPRVVLARTLHDSEGERVPARWLNRLTNLLGGLPEQGGTAALEGMRARGARWSALASRLDEVRTQVTAATRPAPQPPVAQRPRRLSVTGIERLIRDPYAVYAREILGLRRLEPLRPAADAALRGQALHEIMERFADVDPADPGARDALLQITEDVLARRVPWPLARSLWTARIARIAEEIIAAETARRASASILATERKGGTTLPGLDFTVTARADRIDRLSDGTLAILDYKTGQLPTPASMESFDKQLLLEAVIAEAGGFEEIAAATVSEVRHIRIGTAYEERAVPLTGPDAGDLSTAATRAGLGRLVAAWDRRERGYTSRRAVQRLGFEGDYDHLARYGEWDESTPPKPRRVG